MNSAMLVHSRSNYVLDLTEGLHDLGGIRYELVVCLFLCWAIVFFCLSRGVKTMGKVVYFTALFPYVVLIILLIRGLSLPGADKGIMFYLTPEWHRLLDARVWGDAAMQIFFSLSPCWGGLITLASYNKFHNNCLKLVDTFWRSLLVLISTAYLGQYKLFTQLNEPKKEEKSGWRKAFPCSWPIKTLAWIHTIINSVFRCYRDTFFICIGNCGTSFFAGFVIFSIVGFMAHNLGIEVSEVASQGAGLAFVVYPEAVARLPLAPFWSTLFFFMLMTLGMGTQFTIVETVVTTIVDTWPERLRHRKPLVLLCICSAMFALGSVICTRGGMYVLQLMDDYVASYSALTIGLTEVIVIGWVYEADRFLDDIKVMLKKYPFPRVYWKLIWKFVVPSLISVSLVNVIRTNYHYLI